jgi:hypothetical protein
MLPISHLNVKDSNSLTPSLSADNSAFKIQSAGGSPDIDLNMGVNLIGGVYGWLQMNRANNDGTAWPFILNPLGGNVGIGTTAPEAKLHIATESGDMLYIQGTTGGAGNTAGIKFKAYGGYNYPTAAIRTIDDGLYSSHITFLTKVPGEDTNSLSERMRITSDGKVGIGTVSPQDALHVVGNLRIDGGFANDIYLRAAGSGNDLYIESTTGNRAFLYVRDVFTQSSTRYKENIQPIANPFSVLNRLTGVSYDWKNNEGRNYGFIAEEVAKVIPDIVKMDAENPEYATGLSYQQIIPFTVEAVKELNETVERQQAMIDTLNAKLAALESELKKIASDK